MWKAFSLLAILPLINSSTKMSKGFMRLHRQLLNWEWFDNSQMVHLWVYFLLRANYQDTKWHGIDIPRGSLLTSLDSISRETKLSIREIRTCISKLKSTGEVTIKTTNKYSIVTICNYDKYNSISEESDTQSDTQIDKQETSKRQARDKQETIDKEYKESKEVNKEKKEEDTNVSKKKDSELSDLEKEFDEFRVKYKHYGGKARGLQTEFDNLKKKHKDWKEIIPLLNNAIENENKARKEADAMGKFFPNMKNLQTYINNRSWESYITDGTEVSNNEYRPLEFGVQQKWNPARKCLEVPTPYHSMLNDGYTNDNRPDGAMISWQMYMWKWSADKKVWIEQK